MRKVEDKDGTALSRSHVYAPHPTLYSESVGVAEANLEIKNRLGLHLRAASTLAQILKPYASTVTVEVGGKKANARSVTSLIMLGAGIGTKLRVKAEGADAAATLAAVQELFEQRFGED